MERFSLGLLSALLVVSIVGISAHSNESAPFLEASACKVGPVADLDKEVKTFGEICSNIHLSSQNTALVAVDLWQMWQEEKNPMRKETLELVDKFRKNGFTIIHGIGRIAFKEPQYLKFRKEVMNFLGKDYCKNRFKMGGKNYQKIYGYETNTDDCGLNMFAEVNNVKSDIVRPIDNRKEYIVTFEDEMRYVLYKNKIKNLIYVGGALDECILHRSYGINVLSGIDQYRSKFKIYLAKNLITAHPSVVPSVSMQEKMDTLLHSMAFKVAELVDSNKFIFSESLTSIQKKIKPPNIRPENPTGL